MTEIVPVILCGGSGTRLWPLSRAGLPKQFLALSGIDSLFQQAVRRVQLTAPHWELGETLVVTNEAHRFLALDQLREMGGVRSTLLLEPKGRNTAPALTLAALRAMETGSDPILVVTPADQAIQDEQAFTTAVHTAIHAAANGTITVLGVPPDRPETGFGYIRASTDPSRAGVHDVLAFVEKPDLPTAQRYLAGGDYFWNAGIFVLRASTWLQALARFCPDIDRAVRQAWDGRSADTSFVRPNATAFCTVPAESIDYAVIEKCPGSGVAIGMVPLTAGWSDLGAWDALWQIGVPDAQGNVIQGDVLMSESQNTLVHASSRLVGVVGAQNLIVVETPDAVLVADRAHSQDVKRLVAVLAQQQRDEQALPRKVHRPWGWYDSVDQGNCFKVKRIMVKPGASLSLQKHQHRAEHWVVVSGTAEVTCGSSKTLLRKNQSTYIPAGELHRLANPGAEPLEIIEVQSGSYLGEDDIVRFEDDYGRT